MPYDQQARIDAFINAGPWAVVGASSDREKYGNKVLRCYLQNRMRVYPVNPRAERIEGLPCHADLASLPEQVTGVSVITPPKITLDVVADAAAAGVKHIWMQPGAESPEAVELAESHGLTCIADGSCFLVVMGYHEH